MSRIFFSCNSQPRSATEPAHDFGIDLTLLIERLRLSSKERLDRLQRGRTAPRTAGPIRRLRCRRFWIAYRWPSRHYERRNLVKIYCFWRFPTRRPGTTNVSPLLPDSCGFRDLDKLTGLHVVDVAIDRNIARDQRMGPDAAHVRTDTLSLVGDGQPVDKRAFR